MAEPVVLNPEESEFDGGRVVPRVSRLRTVEEVHLEASRLFKAARHGKIECADANRLVPILNLILSILGQSDLEKKVAELERKLLRPSRTGARTSFTPRLVPPPADDKAGR